LEADLRRVSLRAVRPLYVTAVLLTLLGTGCLEDWGEPPKADWSPASAPARHVAETREPCRERHPERAAWFGDLHVHTALSMDAWIRDTRTTPDAAYRFAKGEPVATGPLGADGRPTVMRRLARPLDFSGVTDHAEYLAEVARCTRSDSDVFDSTRCRLYRGETELPIPGMSRLARRMLGLSGWGRPGGLCGDGHRVCRDTLVSVWGEIRDAAERHYDRSPQCSFTTFVAYEWSYSPGRSKVHRNVVFRNASVPELPFSWIDTPTEEALWTRLRAECNESGSGCEALAIAHNPNLSNGRSFEIFWRGAPLEEQRRLAALRAQMQPLVEMMQIKGESECRNGFPGVAGGPDELCEFEKIRDLAAPETCAEGATGSGAMRGNGCVSRLDYARYALVEGLREKSRIGVNPHRFGLIGSTDGHRGAPGDVAETAPIAAAGAGLWTPELRLGPERSFAGATAAHRNPGGLVGLWAEENTRDALFDAMQRRETFATSGPRIRPRLFAGWELARNLCDSHDLVTRADATGVPMGGVLPPQPSPGERPVFVASALRDPGTREEPGGLLQRIQIVKGWVGDDARFHQRVVDVAGNAANGAGVDLDTCETHGPGAQTLCGTWRDPDFDAAKPAVYYARVVENPSCRWHWRDCLTLAPEARPAACSDATLAKTIQERAWTSPIWYEGAGD
jgi:hypothetical protein